MLRLNFALRVDLDLFLRVRKSIRGAGRWGRGDRVTAHATKRSGMRTQGGLSGANVERLLVSFLCPLHALFSIVRRSTTC